MVNSRAGICCGDNGAESRDGGSLLMMVPYDHRLEPIDEQLAKLIAERMRQSKGTNGYPSKEQFDRWCLEYGIDRNIIASVFAAMNNPQRPPRYCRTPTPPQHHSRDAKDGDGGHYVSNHAHGAVFGFQLGVHGHFHQRRV